MIANARDQVHRYREVGLCLLILPVRNLDWCVQTVSPSGRPGMCICARRLARPCRQMSIVDLRPNHSSTCSCDPPGRKVANSDIGRPHPPGAFLWAHFSVPKRGCPKRGMPITARIFRGDSHARARKALARLFSVCSAPYSPISAPCNGPRITCAPFIGL